MNATTTSIQTKTGSLLRDALSLQAIGCPVEVEVFKSDWLLVLSWETGRLHRLLANHPERQLRVPEWALPEFDVIRGFCDDCRRYWLRRKCQHAWPMPILPPEMRRQISDHSNGIGCWEIVEALAATGCNPAVRGAFKWRALCPICRMSGKMDRRLYIERDPRTGRDRLSTFCHCDRRDILAVLGLWKSA